MLKILLIVIGLLFYQPMIAEASTGNKENKIASSGHLYSMIVDKESRLWAWGYNANGVLFTKNHQEDYGEIYYEPFVLMEDVKKIFIGESSGYVMAIKNDDSLWSWGHNNYGTLGNGTTENTLKPTKIMENVKKVSLGMNDVLAITNDNVLWGWGYNSADILQTEDEFQTEDIFQKKDKKISHPLK